MNELFFPSRKRGKSLLAQILNDIRKNDLSTPFFTNSLFADVLPTNDFVPNIEVVRKDKNLTVRAELPGLEKEDFEVKLHEDCLVISGEKKVLKEEGEENGSFYSREISYGSFERSIPIDPEELVENAADQVNAVFNNGILEVKVPIKTTAIEEDKKVKKIEIK